MYRPASLIRRAACIGLAMLATGLAHAQSNSAYPSKPVSVIVPFAPGGSVDSAARLVLQGLSARMKQSFVVENAAGASGTIGTLKAVRAHPDGYTLLFAVASPINVAPVVKPEIVQYDALKDLVPIATVASSPFILIGSPKFAARTTAEVLEAARQAPGKLNYGTDGIGTSMHLTAEMVKLSAGVNIVHVPYRNGPQVLTELSGGTIELAVMPVSLAQPFIRDGKVKAYGVTSKSRWPSLGQVPALAETPGLETIDVDSWYGLLAPRGTPEPLLTRLLEALRVVLKDPALIEKMSTAGLQPMTIERQAFADLLKRERDSLNAVLKAAGGKLQ
ncbi:MAG: hypothetical protein RL322_1156 [Pseudomonadota bacterium]|jgi:tripartite-type tricarboxylate transporter receptor subunit TctC